MVTRVVKVLCFKIIEQRICLFHYLHENFVAILAVENNDDIDAMNVIQCTFERSECGNNAFRLTILGWANTD